MNPESKQGKSKLSIVVIILVVAGICCCVIVAIIMGLSLFGTSAVQRSQRDTARRAALANINLEVASFYSKNGSYPNVNFDAFENTVTIGTGTEATVLTLSGSAKIAPYGYYTSTDTYTAYCYSSDYNTNYKLGVNLEESGWGAAGSLQQLGNNGACGGN